VGITRSKSIFHPNYSLLNPRMESGDTSGIPIALDAFELFLELHQFGMPDIRFYLRS
jgi:hypothetical protein